MCPTWRRRGWRDTWSHSAHYSDRLRAQSACSCEARATRPFRLAGRATLHRRDDDDCLARPPPPDLSAPAMPATLGAASCRGSKQAAGGPAFLDTEGSRVRLGIATRSARHSQRLATTSMATERGGRTGWGCPHPGGGSTAGGSPGEQTAGPRPLRCGRLEPSSGDFGCIPTVAAVAAAERNFAAVY